MPRGPRPPSGCAAASRSGAWRRSVRSSTSPSGTSPGGVEIDCEARIPLCGAACCRLGVGLSTEDMRRESCAGTPPSPMPSSGRRRLVRPHGARLVPLHGVRRAADPMPRLRPPRGLPHLARFREARPEPGARRPRLAPLPGPEHVSTQPPGPEPAAPEAELVADAVEAPGLVGGAAGAGSGPRSWRASPAKGLTPQGVTRAKSARARATPGSRGCWRARAGCSGIPSRPPRPRRSRR